MNLADKVIEANDRANDDGPELDDIGFPFPKPDTERAWCEYLTARILYLNNRIYLYHNTLWINEVPIPETKESYYRLAKYPSSIKDHECQYVWRRLKEVVPELDPDVIAVLPDLTFNMRTGEVKHDTVWTTTPWEEE